MVKAFIENSFADLVIHNLEYFFLCLSVLAWLFRTIEKFIKSWFRIAMLFLQPNIFLN